jgi:integrase
LSEEEEAKLLGVIDVETDWGRRDYALILLLVRSGRRVGEALGLRWGDFEVTRDGVWYEWRDERKGMAVDREKDADQRRARLDWEVWTAICAHLEGCGRLETMQDEDVIFTPLSDICGRVERLHGKDWRKQALAKENIGRMIQMYARWAGLRAEEITPKALRYTALMRRRQAGCGLEEIRRDLGYGSLDAVRLALKHVEMQEVE